jgi:predicted dehydrogenase
LKGALGVAGIEVAAVCATRQSSIDKAYALVPTAAGYTSYEDMLAQADLDAIIVTTPDHLHVPQTVAALEAGKHVLVEKPMALDVASCVKMVEAADRTGKLLMVGQSTRFAPGFQLAKQLIDQGAIGELYMIESEYAHNCEDITGNGDWRTDPANKREAFVGGGSHAADLLRWIAGNPLEVKAYSNQKILKSWPCADTTLAIYQFPNEVIGKVMASVAVRREYTMRSVFYGDKGTIIADNESPFVSVFTVASGSLFPPGVGTAPERMKVDIPVKNEAHNMTDQFINFAAFVRGEAKAVCSARSGANTTAMTCATVEATRTSAAVQIRYPFPEEQH